VYLCKNAPPSSLTLKDVIAVIEGSPDSGPNGRDQSQGGGCGQKEDNEEASEARNGTI
jgi:hypothetical protein